MIDVKVNGVRSRKYAGKVQLTDIVGEAYDDGEVLESVKINGKEVQIPQISEIYVLDGQNVEIEFITLDKSIFKIAKSAIEFLDWLNIQNMEGDRVFSVLSKASSGFEIMENAIFSIHSSGRKAKTDEESKKIVEMFEEINSFTALGKSDEVRKRIEDLCDIYRKIFSRVSEGGSSDGSVHTERNFNFKS